MKEIKTTNAPSAIGPYSQGIQSENTIFVSGQLPICPSTNKIENEIKAATNQMLKNMKAVLNESGADLSNVVKVTIFMSDLEMFTETNDVYKTYFTAPYPARSCVQVARLPKDVLIEAECIAVLSRV